MLAGLMAVQGKRLGSSCLLLLRQNFLGSLFHSETTVGTPMLPGNLSYSLFDHALCCGFQHEKDTEERCSWGSVCCLVGCSILFYFIFFYLFVFSPEMLFGQDPFQKSGQHSVR